MGEREGQREIWRNGDGSFQLLEDTHVNIKKFNELQVRWTQETCSETHYSQFQRAKTESGTQPERSVATHEGSPVRHSHNVSRQTFQDQRQRADAFRMLEGKAMLARESRFQQNRSSKMSERRRHSQMSRSLWSMLPLDPPCGKCSGESFRVTQRVQTRPQSHTEK